MSADERASGPALLRQSLEQAVAGARVSPDPDLDVEGMEVERVRGVAEGRLFRWHAMCPQRFHRATLDTLTDDVREQIEAWRRLAPRPNLVFVGPVGTGKTHAALAAVRDDWTEGGLATLFLPVSEALDRLRPGGDEGALADMLDVERLVLDDLGSQRTTDWTAERLHIVIDRRWMEERPLIATTNLEPGQGGPLMEELGERTYSRLVGSDAVVVRLGGKDRRRG